MNCEELVNTINSSHVAHRRPTPPALAADVCASGLPLPAAAHGLLCSPHLAPSSKKINLFFFKLLLFVKPVTTGLPSSAAGCLLPRSPVSMVTGVNPILPLRMLAVACVCLCARLRSALAHTLCSRLAVPERRQISFKVVCVCACVCVWLCVFPSLIGTV